jgi:DNA-binding transcriptional ArsR family regulator
MNLARPYSAVLGAALEGEVLSVLAGTTRPLTGRQIARLASHGSDRGLRLALNRLAEHGLVDAVDAPPAVLYSLNRDHIAAPIALELAGLRPELLRRLRAAIAEWQVAAMHASMFGSAARGDGDASSDIDLLIVRSRGVDSEEPAWREQVHELAGAVERWTGNHAGISEIGEEEHAQLATERPPIVEELERDAITLAGPEARQLFHSRKP